MNLSRISSVLKKLTRYPFFTTGIISLTLGIMIYLFFVESNPFDVVYHWFIKGTFKFNPAYEQNARLHDTQFINDVLPYLPVFLLSFGAMMLTYSLIFNLTEIKTEKNKRSLTFYCVYSALGLALTIMAFYSKWESLEPILTIITVLFVPFLVSGVQMTENSTSSSKKDGIPDHKKKPFREDIIKIKNKSHLFGDVHNSVQK